MTDMEKSKVDWINEDEINENTDVIILVHEGGLRNTIAFDVLAKKSLKSRKPRLYKWLMSYEDDYKIDCEFVNMFLKRHKDYEYIFSNDFAHTPFFNCGVLDALLKISRKFRTVVVFAEKEGGE